MRRAVVLTLCALLCTQPVAQAQSLPDEIYAVASEAGVSPVDLAGASNTTGLGPLDYLYAVGEFSPPCSLPICGPLGNRLYCIEEHESQHSGTAVNPYSGAAGWLQWLPSTAGTWGVTVGNRWSEWQAAARIASYGERFFRSQWTTLQRGLC